MSTVLIVTLGTSPEPIINCISSLRPDRVVFLCSNESQKLVEVVLSKVPLPDFQTERDVVVLQQRLSGKTNNALENELDQLDRVYLRTLELLTHVREQDPHCRIIADYTGGTKTMTTGLAMAAIDDSDVVLHLTVSDRSGGQASLGGYSAPVAVSTAAIHACRLRERELPALLKRYDYEAARQAVRRVRAITGPDPGTLQWLQKLEALLVGLDAWDRFDHRHAYEVLQGLCDRRLNETLLFPLKRVIGSRRQLDTEAEAQRWPQMKGHGLEAIEDLLRNAERRAAQERYDDAVGRLYRAMELTEQLLLKVGVCDQVGAEGILTGGVDLERLPATIQSNWRNKASRSQSDPGLAKGKVLKIGLAEGFDLLGDLGHPTGHEWVKRRSELVNAIKIRNDSLFAHGFRPIGYSGWRELNAQLGGFLKSAVQQHRKSKGSRSGDAEPIPQLPNSLANLLPDG
ncbi:MAG: TIGR02710 family CRISPR-associated protein [Cyanobacteria bacterium K_Offshore_0m_m2_072]|nr:TIGR02710 family CRISPR-associated protein [Cyanobacteria bacterium K_Offshore_0m_m2_072]